MREEKVMYSKLPDDTNYRRGEVAENDRIPKPIPLIGGTEVYQKDNGTPYWYCRIKEGRDEFMHLYFEDLTEKDLLYYAKRKKRKFVTDRQKKFKDDVLKALKNKPKEGYRWIPVFEPSKDSKGNLQYVAGEVVLTYESSYGWDRIFKEYSPENESQLASITTYFLLALRWLKDGIATLEQLADDSKEIGHYIDSKDAKEHLEKTGEREFGGLFALVGNTFKIVNATNGSKLYWIVGGYYNEHSYSYPFSKVSIDQYPSSTCSANVGFLELTK